MKQIFCNSNKLKDFLSWQRRSRCVILDVNLFILRSIAKQVIPTYINHDRSFRMVSIFFWTRFERREKRDLSLYAERQARKHLVILNLGGQL